MAIKFKLPVARVLPPRALLDDIMPSPTERVMLVDMERLRLSKTYAQLKAQAESWDEAACDEFVLGLMAQGVV